MVEVLNFEGKKSGLAFIVVLLCTIPGSLFSSFVTRKTGSPIRCMQICLVVFISVNFVSFLTLTSSKVSYLLWVYSMFWGFMIGMWFLLFLTLSHSYNYSFWNYYVIFELSLMKLMIGWFYPTEINMYSSLMPKGQETELAGFYLYCNQVLAWLPPLVFTIMNENGFSLSWGGVHLNIYLFFWIVNWKN